MTPRPTTAPTNSDQLRAWDGDAGEYWAEHTARFDASVARYHGHLLAAAAIGPADRVLDVGCGGGQTTRDAARAAADGSALGVDLSSRMLALARRTAEREGVANATFLQADAQIHPFPAAFDVAISRHGAMFFGDPAAAFANIARALVAGGRLVLVTWQPKAEQEWLRTFLTVLSGGRDLPGPPPDGPGPFGLSDPDRVRTLLTGAGFVDVHVTGLREPVHYGPDVDDAVGFVVGNFGWAQEGLDPDAAASAVAALRADVAAHLTDEGVRYGSAAWLVQARRGA